MKRKHLLLMLLMALVAPCAANAQQTHTVASTGTDVNPYVPIFGQYADRGTKTEFIIPAGLLNPMHSSNGCYVTKMTFYLGSQASSAWDASFRVFIKNYGNNQFYNQSFVGDAGAVTVYNGVLNANSSTMEVVFDQNFHYDGQSNILIGFYLTHGGTSCDASFYGSNNSTVNYALNSYIEEIGGSYITPPNYHKFTPKVTFEYHIVQTPTNLQVYTNPGMGVYASWEGNAAQYDLQYENMESVFNSYNGSISISNNFYTFTGEELVPLVQGMKYRYRVRARYTPELTSIWSDWVTYTDCPHYLELPMHANFDYMPVSATNTDNNLPGCWMHANNSTDPTYSSYPLVENNESLCHSNFYPQGQYNYVRFNIPAGGEHQYLIFPPVDVTSSGGVELKFWLRNVDENTAYNYYVGLVNNPLELGDIYTKSDYYVFDYITTYEQKTFTFSQAELQTYGNYLVIMAPSMGNTHVSFCIDDIDIYPANYHCGEPVNVHEENVNPVSARIVWENPETGGGEWGLKYKKASDTEWTIVSETGIVSHQWELAGLEESTTYNAAVINNCNSVDHSEWVECTFTTLAIPVPTNLAANYKSSTLAEVTWSAGGDEVQWQVAYKKASDADWTEIPDRVDQTSYELGPLDPGTEYQVKVRGYHGNAIGYSAWTEPVSYITPLIKTFITEGNWNEAGNWSPEGVPTYTCDVIIQANAIIPSGTVALANAITVTSGKTLTVNSGGLLDATGSITTQYLEGNIRNLIIKDGGQVKSANSFYGTIEKGIVGYGAGNVNTSTGWYLVATPTEVDVNGVFVPKNGSEYLFDQMDFYWFDEGADKWINPKCSLAEGCDSPWGIIPQGQIAASVGLPKKGYLYACQEDATLRFVAGPVGDKPFPATATDVEVDGLQYTAEATFAGWNLIGNPFTCNAYPTQNGNYLAYYRMNATNDAIVLAGSNDPVKPCEGVFVQVIDNGLGYVAPVTFTGTAPGRSNGFDLSLRKAETRSTEAIDRIRIQIGEGGNLSHLDIMADPNRLYIPMKGRDMAVVSTQLVGELPLNFEPASNGSYMLGFENMTEGMIYCHLIDNLTGADIDLLQQPEYTFNAKVGDYPSRFRLVFANTEAAQNGDFFAFFSNGSLIIANEGNATLQVVDMMGRILNSERISGSVETRINAAPGIYVLRLISGDNVRTQKIVVE